VLLAEDHPTNRLVVELMLRACEVDLVLVENGAQAVDAFCAQNFDCILMDMEMPVMDGLSAIRAIRSHEARTGSPPVAIFALSAHAAEDQQHQSVKAGANGHLTKPVQPEVLMKTLSEVLAGKGVGSALQPSTEGQRRGAALSSR
jgi:CheY-like chemotaxis protein